MTHKYNYNYKPKAHDYIWKAVKIFFTLAISVWVLTGVYLLYQYTVPIEPAPQAEQIQEIQKVIIDKLSYVEPAITSAYTAVETCPNTECITASGTRPQKGITVACPRTLPFGTQIEIQGSIYTCEDRTAEWTEGRYDIYFGDNEQAWLMAKEYGLQEHLIKIYK